MSEGVRFLREIFTMKRLLQAVASAVAMIVLSLLVAWSAKQLALAPATYLPHHQFFNGLYWLAEPNLILGVTIVLTWMIAMPGFRDALASHSLGRLTWIAVAALLISVLTLGTLQLVENLLKGGLARARPVTQTEPFIVAAALDGTIPHDLRSWLKGDLFECPIGRAVFKNGFPEHEDVEELARTAELSPDELDSHLRSIRYREGIGPYTYDIRNRIEAWKE